MATRTVSNHKRFFALAKKINVSDYKSFVFDFTNGATDSLSNLAVNRPDVYEAMLAKMEAIANPKDAELDKYRKRLIAAIFGWAKAVNYPAGMRAVKAIACKAARKKSFNAIPKQQLISLYNAFLHKQEDLMEVDNLSGFIAGLTGGLKLN